MGAVSKHNHRDFIFNIQYVHMYIIPGIICVSTNPYFVYVCFPFFYFKLVASFYCAVIGLCLFWNSRTDRFIANSRCLDLETGRELHVGDSFTRSGRCISVQCLDTLELWEDR